MIKVSVVVPVYNVENYLYNCLTSIINQNLKEIEIILVNDGSNDSSGVLCDEFLSKFPNIKVIHQDNKGVSSARNLGMVNASGEYVSFVDSDDWLEPYFLEELYLMGKRYNADIICTGITVNFVKENRIQKVCFPHKYCCYEKDNIGIFFWELHKRKLFNYPVTKIYKNEFLKKKKIKFNENLSVGEDLVFNLQAFTKASKVGVNNSTRYHYMKRENTTLTSSYNSIYKKGGLIQLDEYEKLFSHFSLNEKEHTDFLQLFLSKYYVGFVTNLYKKNNPFNFFQRQKLIEEEIFKSNCFKNKSLMLDKSLQGMVFKYSYFSNSALLMNIVFSLLFLLRNKFDKVYLIIRPFLNKTNQ